MDKRENPNSHSDNKNENKPNPTAQSSISSIDKGKNLTEKIRDALSMGKSPTEIFSENLDAFSGFTIGDYIEWEIANKNTTKANVIKMSGINKRFFYDILSGKKTPSRRYIIRILLALQVELSDAQWYLKAMDYSQLYPRDKRDLIIIYCFEHKLSVVECNKMLNNVKLENLGFENTGR